MDRLLFVLFGRTNKLRLDLNCVLARSRFDKRSSRDSGLAFACG